MTASPLYEAPSHTAFCEAVALAARAIPTMASCKTIRPGLSYATRRNGPHTPLDGNPVTLQHTCENPTHASTIRPPPRACQCQVSGSYY